MTAPLGDETEEHRSGLVSYRPLLALLLALGAFDLFAVIRPLATQGWHYGPGTRSDPYAYSWVLLLLFVPYAYALRSYSRGPRPSLRAVVLGAALVSVPLVFAPPSQSHDVFQYLFYARMQVVHGANPYVLAPSRFSADPWFRYVSWPGQVTVYGPVWSLAVAACVSLVRRDLVAALFLVKGLALALEALAVWGLVRLSARPAEGIRSEPPLAVLAFALNPLVLATVGLGGHADAALPAAFAWAMVFDQRGRRLLAGLLLAAAALVKAYAGIPLLVYVFVQWRRGRHVAAGAVSAAAAGAAVIAYAPYWSGMATFRGLVRVGGFSSSSLAGTVQGWVDDLLRAAGVSGHAHVAALAIRAAGIGVLGAACFLLARSRRTAEEPWRAAAILLGVFLLVTPWSLPWYVVGLLALAIPLADAGLRGAVLTLSGSSLVVVPGAAGAFRTLLRYGTPALVYGRFRRDETRESRAARAGFGQGR